MYYTRGGNTAVAIFFLITGYFKIHNDKIKLGKIVREVFFYSIFSVFLFIIFYKVFGIVGTNTKKTILGTILASFTVPVSSNLWWYVTAYVILVIITPVINPFLRKLSKQKMFLFLVLVWGLFYTLANLLTHFGSFCPYYDLQRAVFFYSIGA